MENFSLKLTKFKLRIIMHHSLLENLMYSFAHSSFYLKVKRWFRKRQNQKLFLKNNPEAKINQDLMSWWSPVRDEYRGLTEEEIKNKFQEQSLPGAVAICHLTGDFNIATIIRTANAFGIKDVFYWGKRKIDRRGAVCSYKYMNLTHLSSLSDLKSLKEKYFFVAVEQNNQSIPISEFKWPSNSLLLIGEESRGLPSDALSLADAIVEIPMNGTIRSLNAGCAASIGLFSYVNSIAKEK
jgi:tRNA G18 (ribose-2'-O)-methylase SpoU